MHKYKVLIRVRNANTNQVVSQRKIFEDYNLAVAHIQSFLSPEYVIKMKFFEDNLAFGNGEIRWCGNELINYEPALNLMKKILKIEN